MGKAVRDRFIERSGAWQRRDALAQMKILVFTSLYPNNVSPNHGVFIKERMTQFVKFEGCTIKVIAPVPFFPPVNINWRWKFSQVAHREIRDGLEVFHPRYILTPKLGMTLYGWSMFLSVLPLVQKIRKQFDFDLIDAHYLYPDGFAAIQLGRFFKKPVVVSARGSDVNLYQTLPLIRKFLRYVLRNADGVIAVSGALKRAMVQLGIPDGKVMTIPNGVDLKKFYPMAKEQARRYVGIECSKLLVSVGNLTPDKGFDLLIAAFSILAKKLGREDIHLAIVGEGHLRKQLEALISKFKLNGRVHLIGAAPHEKLRFWYSAADVFCLASQREGWPNVILESLACGTPVVATAVGGIPEILSTQSVGLLTERDEHKITDTLIAALRKPWVSDALVEYAGHHGWDRTAVEVMDVFQAVLNGCNKDVHFNTAMRA